MVYTHCGFLDKGPEDREDSKTKFRGERVGCILI